MLDPTDRDHRWVYSFADAPAGDKALLGGKGSGLADMTAAGLPVPPGFTITTEACVAYRRHGAVFPEGLWSQTRRDLEDVETATDRTFGDPARPLLLSVRSGAAVSMPGMMDTVLNLGLNDETAAGLAAETGDARFAWDAYRRFVAMFGEVVMGVEGSRFERVLEAAKRDTESGADTDLSADQLRDVVEASKRIVFAEHRGQPFPDDPDEQLRMAIAAVFDSWDNPRARAYRRVHAIADDIGTGVTVQAMVFGNTGWDSGTGVAFTRDPSTGKKTLFGEYLLNAQGEDVVAGTRTPRPIAEMADDLPNAHAEFREIAERLEAHYGDVQDVEFTVERGRLWLLQTRTAKRSGAAAVRVAVEMVAEGVIDERAAVARVQPTALDGLLHPTVDPDATVEVLAEGLPASPGAAQGRAVFTPDRAEAWAADGEPVILVRHETSPDDFHGMVAAQAVVTARGGMTSHAAVVARGMGTP
ncbi:pyruvate, phosphate dikinase, partial [Rubrivirga sp.]|uniref:pyruvate, phosphate dikinase n=1 Tax=Rubrivirga sp. TaxID=1885344 RepID=UPI003C755244